MPAVASEPRVDLDAAFKALASEQRRQILSLLSRSTRGPSPFGSASGSTSGCSPQATGEVCACVIAEHLGLAASTISHHMGLLRDAGLVDARKDGLWVHYRLRRDALDAAAEALKGL
jgi:DNA-binding transcriptional ArsR family regulator